MNQAFYLKYRPQTFTDLDSVLARDQLIEIFSSGRIPHALLFSGSKGIGKTSAARIVAKAVNCESQSNKASELQRKRNETMKPGDEVADETLRLSYEPCNKCDSCISITNGSNVDVLEIDAASYTGIDDIRELRDKIKFSPAKAKYKVYIVDEVHRLSPQAFDALLKTLEEPPKHAIFILCTTDPEKLPKTIISRCQQINFKKATIKEITERLEKICLLEKIEFEKLSLEKIARFSEGSFRDATKMLEQISFGGKITSESVEKMIGLSGSLQIKDFLETLKNKQTEKSLKLINKFAEEGINLRLLIENILDQLRTCLLSKFNIGGGNSEIDFSTEECQTLIEIFNQAYFELKNAVIPQLPLEMAVVEWGEDGRKLEVGNGKQDETRKGNDEKLTVESGSKKLDIEMRNEKKDKSSNQKVSLHNPTSHVPLPTSTFSIEDVTKKWSEILEAVKPLNHSVLAFLRACRPKTVEGGFLILEVFYKFHKDQLEAEKCRRVFEQAASGVLNCPVKLKCELSQGKPDKLPPVPLPPVDQTAVKSKTEKSKKSDEDDILKVAEEIFNKQ